MGKKLALSADFSVPTETHPTFSCHVASFPIIGVWNSPRSTMVGSFTRSNGYQDWYYLKCRQRRRRDSTVVLSQCSIGVSSVCRYIQAFSPRANQCFHVLEYKNELSIHQLRNTNRLYFGRSTFDPALRPLWYPSRNWRQWSLSGEMWIKLDVCASHQAAQVLYQKLSWICRETAETLSISTSPLKKALSRRRIKGSNQEGESRQTRSKNITFLLSKNRQRNHNSIRNQLWARDSSARMDRRTDWATHGFLSFSLEGLVQGPSTRSSV